MRTGPSEKECTQHEDNASMQSASGILVLANASSHDITRQRSARQRAQWPSGDGRHGTTLVGRRPYASYGTFNGQEQ